MVSRIVVAIPHISFPGTLFRFFLDGFSRLKARLPGPVTIHKQNIIIKNGKALRPELYPKRLPGMVSFLSP